MTRREKICRDEREDLPWRERRFASARERRYAMCQRGESLPGAKGDFAVTQKQIRHVPKETRRSAVTKLPPPAGRGRSASKMRMCHYHNGDSGDSHAVETYMQWKLTCSGD